MLLASGDYQLKKIISTKNGIVTTQINKDVALQRLYINYSISPNPYFKAPKTGAISAFAISGVTFPLA